MFSQACVKISVHGGVGVGGEHCGGACMAGGVHGRGAYMAGVCVWQWGMHGRGICGRGAFVARGEACIAGEMATAADGTYPTGMHSFFF